MNRNLYNTPNLVFHIREIMIFQTANKIDTDQKAICRYIYLGTNISVIDQITKLSNTIRSRIRSSSVNSEQVYNNNMPKVKCYAVTVTVVHYIIEYGSDISRA